jgi:hypothetical protein
MKVVLIAMLALIVSCKKEKDSVAEKKSAAQLLTQEEWILNAAGFDDNKNGVLEPAENSIQDCQKDNSYIFNMAGTGAALDNTVTCGGPVNNNFEWRLLNNDTELEIEFERILILRLNENELILNPVLPGLAINFMMVYRH